MIVEDFTMLLMGIICLIVGISLSVLFGAAVRKTQSWSTMETLMIVSLGTSIAIGMVGAIMLIGMACIYAGWWILVVPIVAFFIGMIIIAIKEIKTN